ncbi:hypothetical protein N658DRAFT_321840 [Parathielavia hyrcaniae]|uniref:Uncharacterized protein n=1 Tax=Parathielavia hyrcaniae TaxID=113614 RepID=A0AAN6Q883_9PEZI|nr:hypothetical protein N658DRAFT_321840 [Parathielavia hyrcaniae]
MSPPTDTPTASDGIPSYEASYSAGIFPGLSVSDEPSMAPSRPLLVSPSQRVHTSTRLSPTSPTTARTLLISGIPSRETPTLGQKCLPLQSAPSPSVTGRVTGSSYTKTMSSRVARGRMGRPGSARCLTSTPLEIADGPR